MKKMTTTTIGGLATAMLASTTMLLSSSVSSVGAFFQSGAIHAPPAFLIPSRTPHDHGRRTGRATTTEGGGGTGRPGSTALFAIGVLAKKAKEAELRRYVEDGVPDDVMEKYNLMKKEGADSDSPPTSSKSTKLQDAITKRRGTISVIAEYKRKLESGYMDEVFEPSILSATFREFGASAASVMVDERVGGCTYADVTELVDEQQTAKGDVPGPLPVIAHDVLVDELQIAMAAAAGADAVVLSGGVVGEGLRDLIEAGARLGVEAVVTVANREEAKAAVRAGGRIICVVAGAATDPKERADMLDGLESEIPDAEGEGETICRVCAIPARVDSKDLEEVAEAWMLRDLGFQAVLAADCLYKAGNDPNEHAGAIIRSMIAKSSVQWASPTARSGKGEGSREYLGDIMM